MNGSQRWVWYKVVKLQLPALVSAMLGAAGSFSVPDPEGTRTSEAFPEHRLQRPAEEGTCISKAAVVGFVGHTRYTENVNQHTGRQQHATCVETECVV